MFCTVYLLREDGRRLTTTEVKARGGVEGFLVFGQRPVLPEHCANLRAGEADGKLLLPELQFAKVAQVRGGVLLRGLLVDPATYASVPQAWRCVPLSGRSQISSHE